MKFTIINDKLKEYFYDLDPFELLKQDFPSNTLAIGQYIEDEDSKASLATGLAIISVTTSSVIVKWLFVDEDFRGQGYGSAILDKIFSLAKDNDKQYVKAFIFKTLGRQNVCLGERDYFKEKGFIVDTKEDYLTKNVADYFNEDEEFDEINVDLLKEDTLVDFYGLLKPGQDTLITLENLKENAIFSKNLDLNAIQAIAEEEMLDFIRQMGICKKNGGLGVLETIDENFDLSYIDLDLSCYIDRGNGLEAILVIARPETNLLMPLIFRSFSNEYLSELGPLLLYAYKKAGEKYQPYTRIILRGFDDKSNNAISQVLSRGASDLGYTINDFETEREDLKSASKIIYRKQDEELLFENEISIRLLVNPSYHFLKDFVKKDYLALCKKQKDYNAVDFLVALDMVTGNIAGCALVGHIKNQVCLIYFEVDKRYSFEDVAISLFNEFTAFADRFLATSIIAHPLEEDIDLYEMLGFYENESGDWVLDKNLE